ncbi:MAG: MoaD/ThiS family protein [Thermodesulfobacteriaceae bacterium]|nr:MoaD/ThiS family protein [Thermodesulfobacteriaceae bacterium]MCX8042129.1 MoaD/ThiS family protein [Thermodesulfobacteriaceae bacterium]MDW8135737.1 MoaD/ThiS family protein [Thermodesulfobacterium sp.]
MIKVKLFADFRKDRGKEVDFEYFEGINGKFILEKLKIDEKEIAVFLVNGKNKKLDEPLEDGDVIALFPPIAGG